MAAFDCTPCVTEPKAGAQRTCQEPGCSSRVYGHNRCRRHWAHWYKQNPGPNRKRCKEPDCGGLCVGLGWCGKHYQRFVSKGSAAATLRMKSRTQSTAADGTRLCYVCGVRKPRDLQHFGYDHRTRDRMRGTCRDCQRSAIKAWTKKAKYGIDRQRFNAMLAAQESKCALCNIQLVVGSRKANRACIDHDHKTSAIRGLLCHHCNVMLGHAQDSASLLRRAATYLDAWAAP